MGYVEYPSNTVLCLFPLQFRQYHQSEVRLQGRSRLKDGWWAGAVEGQAGGQNALVKLYEGEKGQAAKVGSHHKPEFCAR